MQTRAKSIVALVLACFIVITALPITGFAAGEKGSKGNPYKWGEIPSSWVKDDRGFASTGKLVHGSGAKEVITQYEITVPNGKTAFFIFSGTQFERAIFEFAPTATDNAYIKQTAFKKGKSHVVESMKNARSFTVKLRYPIYFDESGKKLPSTDIKSGYKVPKGGPFEEPSEAERKDMFTDNQGRVKYGDYYWMSDIGCWRARYSESYTGNICGDIMVFPGTVGSGFQDAYEISWAEYIHLYQYKLDYIEKQRNKSRIPAGKDQKSYAVQNPSTVKSKLQSGEWVKGNNGYYVPVDLVAKKAFNYKEPSIVVAADVMIPYGAGPTFVTFESWFWIPDLGQYLMVNLNGGNTLATTNRGYMSWSDFKVLYGIKGSTIKTK